MKSFFLVPLFTLLFASTAWSGLEELHLEDLEGMIPSFLLDHTGFQSSDGFISLNVQDAPLVPLLPLYQGGGFGKKTYVGGVVEGSYLQSLTRLQLLELKEKIRLAKTAEGIPLHPVAYDGKLYAIRSDYQISYQNTTSVGLSFSFGGGGAQSVILGNTKTFGLSLDFSSPIRIGKTTGVNAGAAFQTLLDDWTTALRPDDTKFIIDQAVAITPLLMSYLGKSEDLVDERGLPLQRLLAEKNLHNLESPGPVTLTLPNEGDHSKEWNKIKQSLSPFLQKEAELRKEVQSHIAQQKILATPEHQEIIQELCDRLATVYEVPTELWPRCQIAATLVPNAWAYPGGDIFITAGLLGILSEVDSVALVLGHEIGHVMARHVSRRTKSTKTVNYAATFISSAVNLALTTFSLGGGLGTLGNVSFISWYPQMLASSVGGSIVAQKGLELTLLAPAAGLMLQSREYESQADRLGQEAAFVAGSELEKMNRGWGEFVDFFDQNFPRKLSLREKLMQDHPDSKARLNNFQQRSTLLANLLREVNQKNPLTPELRAGYQKMYRSYRPYILAYAKQMKKNIETTEANKVLSKRDKKVRHFFQTIAGPHSQCIKHALGGY